MKRNITSSVLFIASLSMFLLSAQSNDDDPDGEAGATGSPNEETCADTDCHETYMLNSGPGSVVISSPDLVNWEYVPGETYTVSVTVSQTGIDLFGLGFEALKSNGDNAGTLVAGSDTQIKNKTVAGFQRKNITHDEGTGAGTDFHTFTFTWHAPTSNVGDITFYVAGNACNNNENKNGDYVYTANQVVSVAVGVYEINRDENLLEVFPNPVTNNLTVVQHLSIGGNISFRLFDQRGALVRDFERINHDSGELRRTYDISMLTSGIYMLQTSIDGNTVASKVIEKK
ncbi:MAG: T9SS type A sorting domain-containing protein [Flavobacteriales bacterium]|nr:T9SS type A sorting domain-containing protein [Flavobacteriales bacterium]